MSNQTNTANETTILSLLNELDVLSRTVQSLREKVLKIIPVKYGSSAWWKKSNEEAINQIRAGEGIVIENKQELKKFFNL